VSRRQRIHNVDIKERLGVKTDLQHRLQKRNFRHVERRGPDRHSHIALHGLMDGVRARGRPRRRWLDNKDQDCDKISSKQAGVEIFCDEAAVARPGIAKAISQVK